MYPTLRFWGWSIAAAWAISCMPAGLVLPTRAAETRDRAWLVRFVNQPIPDAPRNRRYVEHVNRQAGYCLDVDADWLNTGRGNALEPARSHLGRLSCLAYAWRTKGLRYYQDPAAWEKLERGLLGVARNIQADGTFAWGPKAVSHEHAWLVESSLLTYLWLREHLPPDRRRTVDEAIFRAAQTMVQHPVPSASNQGSVWCAVTALASLYYEKPEWMAAAHRHADAYMLGGTGNLYDDGEIGEHHQSYKNGGGPDCNYTYTGLAYIYAYRLWSGRSEIDPLLMKAARWLTGYHTLSGCGVVPGASARLIKAAPAVFPDVLPFYESMSKREPFFGRLAALSLEHADRYANAFGGHVAAPAIWAMLEAGIEDRGSSLPAWQLLRTELYGAPQRTAVCYALVSRRFQTGIVFANGVTASGERKWPFKGLQTWAWDQEGPVVCYANTAGSSTRADGIDTGRDNVDKGPSGDWEVVLSQGPALADSRSALATITERRRTLWTVYAFTPISTVVVYGGAQGNLTSRWIMNPDFVSEPTLDTAARQVSFADRKGRLSYLAGQAQLGHSGGSAPAHMLEVVAPAPLNAFGFSDGSLKFETPANEVLDFSDASGRYRLSLREMMEADGPLNRRFGNRLTTVQGAVAK